MSRVRTLQDLEAGDLQALGVLVRADYNVPLAPSGRVADPTRVVATLPTLSLLRQAGARTVLMSHLGRPEGITDPGLSLAVVAEALSERLGISVPLIASHPGGEETRRSVEGLRPGEVAILENTRFQSGETRNDPELARALGSLADVFVSDAFGVAHRTHASNVGAAAEIRVRGGPAVAGLLMARELHFLDEALKQPARPFVAVMGGAKISGKLELVRCILPRVDRLLVGGAMANTFLLALGLEVGRSLVEEDLVPTAARILDEAGDKLILPVDCVVAADPVPSAGPFQVDRADVGADARIADIGPRSREVFARELLGARTILWNGPMGIFESEPYSGGTLAVTAVLAEAADRGAVVVLGGGDSAAAAHAAGIADRMTHVSTGGGASLDLLAGKGLPGVSVLETVNG